MCQFESHQYFFLAFQTQVTLCETDVVLDWGMHQGQNSVKSGSHVHCGCSHMHCLYCLIVIKCISACSSCQLQSKNLYWPVCSYFSSLLILLVNRRLLVTLWTSDCETFFLPIYAFSLELVCHIFCLWGTTHKQWMKACPRGFLSSSQCPWPSIWSFNFLFLSLILTNFLFPI